MERSCPVEVRVGTTIGQRVLLRGVKAADISKYVIVSTVMVIDSAEDAHGLHIHAADAPQEGFFEVLLNELLAVLILLILASGLGKLFLQHLHLLLVAVDDVAHLLLHSVAVDFSLMLPLHFPVCVSPPSHSLHLESAPVVFFCLCHFEFVHFILLSVA